VVHQASYLPVNSGRESAESSDACKLDQPAGASALHVNRASCPTRMMKRRERWCTCLRRRRRKMVITGGLRASGVRADAKSRAS
jgi:hypothetical protein